PSLLFVGLAWTPTTLTTTKLVALALVAFAALGVGRGAIADARVRSSTLARSAGRAVELWGTLADDPQEGKLGWHATLAVDAWQPGRPPSSPIRGTVWLQGHGRTPREAQGDRLFVTGLLRSPRGDFLRFLRQRGIAASCTIGEF